MTLQIHTFTYGKRDITYKLIRVNRKTLEIAVHPDDSIIVKAPVNADIIKIGEKIKSRARWILKQQRYFEQFNPKMTQRYYLSGETHLYLGKRYQLKVIQDSNQGVLLRNGRFFIHTHDKSQHFVQAHMQKWYRKKAEEQFQSSLARCWRNEFAQKFDMPRMQVKIMKKRWGSLSPGGILTLNLELIKAPKECIDYVITHELCHLKYSNHSKEFFQLLEELLPNWKKTKYKLEILMS
ncbi:MAG: SprT family zinc-dependent metalloprotease [Candidatus Marinimicrobia bacterium]|nr:SprT family zinc-dependent metalloprotease [Candidatus Neomarinimicrobiota bacterium]